MGGKKKTKWRKLPLEEFTKEVSSKSEKLPPADSCQTDFTRDENSLISPSSETSETPQSYAEPYECIDGLWYPTSCVVYNPSLYCNYMMPVDNCYYYYTVPEAGQMQECMPVTYQEYAPALPKDTVYLLLPSQALRPTQPVQNVVPEWQNRRRRRRYEGYADYAVIPEKTSSLRTEEKEQNKVQAQHVRRKNSQFSSFKRMTSFTETNTFDDPLSEQNQISSKSNDMKKNSTSSESFDNERNPYAVNKEIDLYGAESNYTFKKNPEICGIHSRNKTTIKEQITGSKKTKSASLRDELHRATDMPNTEEGNRKICSNELSKDISMLPDCANTDMSHLSTILEITKDNHTHTEQPDTKNMNLSKNELSGHVTAPRNFNHETNLKINTSKLKEDVLQQIPAISKIPPEDVKSGSQSSLPDILSSLNKATNEKLPDNLEKDKHFKSKSFLSQTSYLPNLLSSEALHNEMEMELRQLQSLNSLQANQSIYKLAYDENVTDQSEADSRSPSPIDPESQVPSSLTSAEILIHEADSGSDAGSEDVELLPHRYESETFLNENKHVYVNKLSLAVELLRTQESLPYDDEFKRVVGENNIVPGVHTGGKVNLGFMEDSCSSKALSIANNFEIKRASTSTNVDEIISQCDLKHSADSSNDSAIFSDVEFSNFEDDLCEPANEAVAQGNGNQDNTEEIRAGYRRFGIQAQHYFSPRAALSLNPCFCCVVM